jgi:hypothetical protein
MSEVLRFPPSPGGSVMDEGVSVGYKRRRPRNEEGHGLVDLLTDMSLIISKLVLWKPWAIKT